MSFLLRLFGFLVEFFIGFLSQVIAVFHASLKARYKAFLKVAFDPQASAYPGKLKIPKQPKLSNEERKIEARFAAQLESHLPRYVYEYCRRHHKVLNTDEARELSADYNQSVESRARYARAVHEPAGALIKAMWRAMLRTEDPDGNNDIVFMAGGGGSGKTTAVNDLPALRDMRDQAHIVYDTTMANERSSIAKVEEALSNGKNVIILYVHRPCDKAALGMLERAIRSGRTVPAEILAEDHYNAQRTFIALLETYGEHDDVALFVIDNSGEPGEAELKSVDFIHGVLYNEIDEVKTTVKEVIENEHLRRKGTDEEIPEYIYRAIIGQEL